MAEDIHKFRHDAMNTWFEMSIRTDNKSLARNAATEAFREIDRLENLLSRFREGSDVDILNKKASREPVRVTEECWKCILQAMDLEILTDGVFSIAFEAFMLADNVENKPVIGAWLEMDPTNATVFFKYPDLRIDLGGIGKGYALDLVAQLMEDWDVTDFLLHSGTSSVIARGNQEGSDGWIVSVGADISGQDLTLRNESLSASSLAVQSAHILNLKSQAVLETDRRTWAWAPSGAISDALSTTFMLVDSTRIEDLCSRHEGLGALVVDPEIKTPLVYGVAKDRLTDTNSG